MRRAGRRVRTAAAVPPLPRRPLLADKTPYKTAAAAAGESEGGAVYYVQLSSAGLFVGSGCYHMAPDQLTRFRSAVDDDRTGTAVEHISASMAKGRLRHGGPR